MDYIDFETSPIDEDCVQVDSNADYMPAMKLEADRMLTLLCNKFPDIPGYFTKVRHSHDFGSYIEIRYNYNDNDEEESDSADFVENNFPYTWNDTEVCLWSEQKGK